MGYPVLDMLKGTSESGVFGSTEIMALAVIVIGAVFLLKAKQPPYMFLLLIVPLVIGFAESGMIPSYLQGVALVVIAFVLGAAVIKIFR